MLLKGFCGLLFEVSTKALGSMGYLTIITRSNRVVIVSSVTTRIFFEFCAMPGRSHFNLFNKDTHDLFMLCIVLMCQLYRVVFYHCCSIYYCCLFILFVVRSVHLLFAFCSHSILLLFIYSLFMFKRKRFNSDPGLYSRYFDPVVQELSSSSMQVNKHHTSDCTDFFLV